MRQRPAATCLPPAGPLEAHAEVCAAGAGGLTTVETCASELVEGTSPQGLTYHFTHTAGNVQSAPPYICRVVFLLLNVCLRRGRRRPTPRFCAAGASGVTTVVACISAAAKV
jgi:hypothetical protein